MPLTPAANITSLRQHTPEERHPHELELWQSRHFVHHDYQHGRRNYAAEIFHNTDQLLLLGKGRIQKSGFGNPRKKAKALPVHALKV
jgi:hypothetical protein